MHRAHEADDRDVDLRFSLGFYVNEEDGTIADVIPGSPADAAGLGSGDRLIAVNGRKWSRPELHDAVAATSHGAHTVTLLVDQNGSYRSVELHYEGGPREPHLVRIEGSPDLLTRIARPRASAAH
jgi:predicted metalloprotease with PDZ domain